MISPRRPHSLGDDDESTPLQRAQVLVADTAGRLAEFWGFTRTMGRVFGLLYVSLEPLTQAEIGERLCMSTANVSMSLAALIQWRAVHKVHRPAGRKARYQAETELRKVIRHVMRNRERRELLEAKDSFAVATKILRDLPRSARSVDEKFALDRIAHLQWVVRISDRMLTLLLGQGRLDLKAALGEDVGSVAPR